jgi:outer membrane protein insertion porin family
LTRIRAALLAASLLLCALGPSAAPAQDAPIAPGRTQLAQMQGGTVAAIRVEGNQRIEEGTIRSYMLVRPGDPFDPEQLDRTLKTLYATGLFSDVALRREGNTLVVRVAEYPIVNRIAFEGNHQLSDETLRPELQLRPRAVFSAATARSDRQRLLNLYARRGRYAAKVEPKIIKLDQNRVDVVFEIDEGASTLTARIAFVGNRAFSESKLNDVIASREQAWWRFLSSSDSYDPDRLNYDKEQLRRFYLSKGYADIEIVSADAELTPDRSAFFLTFTIKEGERYTVAKDELNVTLKGVEPEWITSLLPFSEGDWYDGDAVERAVKAISEELQGRGFPFVEVKPRVQKDAENHTISLVFDVADGPHSYVERINIVGNQRTQDKVIRREFRLAEGDPFNASLVRLSRQRIDDLDYFSKVDVQAQPGSAPDKVILNTAVEEKATGQFTIGGGYSTDIGALASVGLREKNLVGSGIDAGVNTVLAQKQTQINLSITDPSFLDRNLVAGFDLFHVVQNNISIADYRERRTGTTLRVGYEFSEHLRQLLSYSLIQRQVYDVGATASIYVKDAEGDSLLSQVSQALTLDFRDSRLEPHRGWVMRIGTDVAGLGGDAHFFRGKIDASYYLPLERFTGDPNWVLAISAGVGDLINFSGTEFIIDRFFLGGDNLRGFAAGGVGPHATNTGDSIGGRFMWTQSTELRFPLPVSADLGLTGRAFVDIGSLSQVDKLVLNGVEQPLVDYASPRVGVGVGVSWRTPFGLINIDIAQAVVKRPYDQTQLFRLGFGTRF